MRLSTRTILLAVLLTVALGAQTLKEEIEWDAVMDSILIADWEVKPITVDFYNNDKRVFSIDLKTGNVEIAKDLDMNEASRLFWKILQKAFPLPCTDKEVLK